MTMANIPGTWTPPVTGYAPAAPAPGAPSYPAPVASSDAYTPMNVGQGPILPLQIQKVANAAAKVVPAGKEAAKGAFIALNGGRGASELAKNGEPLLRLSWGFVANVADTLGAILTLRVSDAVRGVGKVVGDGAINTGRVVEELTLPLTLTARSAGATRLGLGAAIGVGLQTGLTALKSSFVWAIPAAAINAFIDYKYKDQTDTKRLMTNFGADVIGYTATGMAGAGVGAAVGSMTAPIVGTIVGIGVSVVLGMAHDHTTRPLISDMLRDQFA